jgi:putative metalloprotease
MYTMLALVKYNNFKEGAEMKRYLVFLFALTLLVTATAQPALSKLRESDVNKVWQKVANTAGLEHFPKVQIEDKKEPNAWVSFSLDKYSVHITNGMLGLLETDDQLAGILSHETGHIQLGHYKESMSRNILWMLLYKAIGQDGLAGDAVGLGLALAESGFSREQEVEADDYGIRLASKAGYDPWGLVQSLELMKKAGYKTSPNGFNSHPPTDRRLVHVRNTARTVSRQ